MGFLLMVVRYLVAMKSSSVLATIAMVMISTQAAGQPAAAPPAIFVFGDGALDVGNNNDLTGGEIGDPDRANHPYYGIDYPGGQATGRFSNGYNIADFIGTHHLPICML
jgi:hypothetical protein